MDTANEGSRIVALRCHFVKTYCTADSVDLHVKFSPLTASLGLDKLREKLFLCEDAELNVYDTDVYGKCGNSVKSHRTEIRFSIFAEERAHECSQCNVSYVARDSESGSDRGQTATFKDSTAKDEPADLGRASAVPEIKVVPKDAVMGNITCSGEECAGDEVDNSPCGDSIIDDDSGEQVKSGKEIQCGKCHEKFDSEIQLSSHSVLHVQNLTCDVCSEVFDSRSSLQKHMRSHAGQKCFKCEHCDKSFLDRSDLAVHVREHSGEKVFQCKECGKLFSRIKALKRHTLNYHSNIPVHICKVCRMGFTDEEDLRSHVFTDHKGNEKTRSADQQYKCSLCPKSFIKSSLLKNHLRLHRNGKPYRCMYCGITFKDELSFELHQEIHKGETGKPFTCKNCGQCFSSLTLLKRHKASHDDDIYKCEICDKIFQSGKSLKDHQNIHSGIKSYVCKVCGKALVSANRLKSHLKTHIIDKPYKCEYCQKSFINPGDLTNHRRVHTGEKPYLCEICGKGFAYKTSVPKHMVVHSNLKPYQCDICHKEFASSLQMHNHKKIHLGLKNFICEVCGKRFTTGKALKVHKLMHEGYTGHDCDICGKKYRNVYYLEIHKKTHTGKNLLQCHMCGDSFADPTYFKLHQRKFCKTILIYCELCNRGFPNNKDLKSHMGYHSGERPYGCDVCGKAFAKSAFLADHMKRHNPETLIKCSVCGKGFINKKEVRRHEARHKNINKKRASPRIAVSIDPNQVTNVHEFESGTIESKTLGLSLPSTSIADSHDQVLQEYAQSIESIRKSVIPTSSGYEMRSDDTTGAGPIPIGISSGLPHGPPQGLQQSPLSGPSSHPANGTEGPPVGLTPGHPPLTSQGQPLMLPAADPVHYAHMDSCTVKKPYTVEGLDSQHQIVNDPIPPHMDSRRSYSSVFTRESGEMVLMQEGLAAIMDQTVERRAAQTFVPPPLQYFYPSQQNRYPEGDSMHKYS
ncbi:zinc finger protein 665-like [Haliotis asinina]|uniref:zinc finger protein 665-like n=1 Tax=Haliotis asinina TaxID=109174 RepID=UPI0035324FE3